MLWKVVPDRVAEDSFGSGISRKYYAVEVVIGNNSGYDLQLASVGFLLRDFSGNLTGESDDNQFLRMPDDDYHIVRSTVEKTAVAGARAYVLNSLQAAVLMGTGLTPYFHVVSHVANYTTGLNLAGAPLSRALGLVWPDMTVQQLSKLDNLSLHDSATSSNNSQLQTIVYVTKESLKGRLATAKNNQQKNPNCSGTGKNTEGACYIDPKDPESVKYWLGNLVIVGNQIAYRQRIHIVTSSTESHATTLSISPKNFLVTDLKNGTKVTLSGDGVSTLASPLSLNNNTFTLTLDAPAADAKSRTGTLTTVPPAQPPFGSVTLEIPLSGSTVPAWSGRSRMWAHDVANGNSSAIERRFVI